MAVTANSDLCSGLDLSLISRGFRAIRDSRSLMMSPADAGKLKIKDGDDSTFIAERSEGPAEPIPDPPSYRDKWRRRW